MLIDWFTVVAQVINFLVLVWLLKRFLYKPILDALDAREQRIARQLAEADAAQAEARQERDEFERKNHEFAQQRDALVSEMKDEISVMRQKLLDDVHRAADVLRAKRHEELRREQQSIGDAICRRAQAEVFAITRKTLGDLADASLEERVAATFIRRVRELSGEPLRTLANALSTSSNPACVRSAFTLSANQQAAIQQALNETFAGAVPVRFETAPDVVAGVELVVNGSKVAWSISDYLKLLEKNVSQLIQEQAVADENGEKVP